MLAPEARFPITRSQPGAEASLTVTLLSATSPLFVTVIVNIASVPATACCDAGSFVTSIAGLIASKSLPADPKHRILGVNGRAVVVVGYAALFSILEIPLEASPHFAWVYPWWGALPVFVTVYIPFFAAAVLAHDWPRARQKRFIGGLFALDAALLVLFGPILRWI